MQELITCIKNNIAMYHNRLFNEIIKHIEEEVECNLEYSYTMAISSEILTDKNWIVNINYFTRNYASFILPNEGLSRFLSDAIEKKVYSNIPIASYLSTTMHSCSYQVFYRNIITVMALLCGVIRSIPDNAPAVTMPIAHDAFRILENALNELQEENTRGNNIYKNITIYHPIFKQAIHTLYTQLSPT